MASIDWGDPSPDPAAGTITQDASNPIVYYITGTHTFTAPGTFTVANTVAFCGRTYSSTVNGVPLSITLSPVGPTAGTSATANVTQGALTVSAFPIVGTKGSAIVAGPIATFIDSGGADSIANYSATITITNSAGATIVSVPAASITQNGNAAQFTVNAPALTLPEAGTYRVLVAVTDSDGATASTALGVSTAVIAEAAVVATPVAVTAVEGQAFTNTTVATFTDPGGAGPVGDYSARIDWGDRSAPSLGTITVSGGVFTVAGSHVYGEEGAIRRPCRSTTRRHSPPW